MTSCPRCGMPLADIDRAGEMIAMVAVSFGLTAGDLVGTSRSAGVVQARHLAMLVVRDLTVLSYPQIGELFNRNHSTVMYGCDQARFGVARGGWLSELYALVVAEFVGPVEAVDSAAGLN